MEHRDYERVCLGELGFSYLIESLAGLNSTYGVCDIGVSSVTVSSEREDMGIKFSRATHRSSLAIMVHAPLKERGNWTFFDPLHWKAWIALLATVAMTPMVVFFIEAVFNKWCAPPTSSSSAGRENNMYTLGSARTVGVDLQV